jgi:two-component system LytT family response regulator
LQKKNDSCLLSEEQAFIIMKTRIELCPRLQLQQPIYIEEILWLEGTGNYTLLHLENGQQILTSKTLSIFDKLLPNSTFLRINKSIMVSMRCIESWTQQKSKHLQITLQNGQTVRVSRRRIWAVVPYLNNNNTI